MKSKLCYKCKVEYPLSCDFFNIDNRSPDGLNGLCKKCRKIYYERRRSIESKRYKIYYSLNKSKFISRTRKYREQEGNRERDRQTAKLYREKNKEKIKEINRQYMMKNRRKIKASQKKYREKNAALLVIKKRQYYINNKAKINAYHRHRLKTNVNYRMTANLRSRLWSALRSQNVKKTNRTMYLVGCSMEFLKGHLESNFTSGMSWDNYGRNGWSIDHIIPCAAFDLLNIKEQKKCFNYKNLRPMWEKDNFRKNSFYNGKMIKARSDRHINELV